jgi:hypothetical protein
MRCLVTGPSASPLQLDTFELQAMAAASEETACVAAEAASAKVAGPAGGWKAWRDAVGRLAGQDTAKALPELKVGLFV